MIEEQKILDAVIATVPQWYRSARGPNRREFQLNGVATTFCSPIHSSPILRRLETFAAEWLQHWFEQQTALPGAVESIQERLALEWLSFFSPEVRWSRLLEHFSNLRYRTYENTPVVVNLVISEGSGSLPITDEALQKYLDPLATSSQVFMRLDPSLYLTGYEEIPWSEVRDTEEFKFSPEFLQPIASTLKEGEFSVHQTQVGDLIIMNHDGMIASKRKGRWHLYETKNLALAFKSILTDAYGRSGDINSQILHQKVGAHLFEIICDLSYKRHGALLVYDPLHKVPVTNVGSLLDARAPEEPKAHHAIGEFVRDIQMSHDKHWERKKRLFLEIASLDGAVIFDSKSIRAFGAMVAPHEAAGMHPGTRTAAAHSAYHYGGLPIKISSDGDVRILFSSSGSAGVSQAEFEFS